MRGNAICVLVLLASCGPSHRDGGGGGDDTAGPDAYAGPTGTMTGRVWAPGMAPGVAAPGEEIPVAGAAVYLSPVRPEAIPSTVYCEPCQKAPDGSAITDATGAFTLPSTIPGRQWLVIQKAQFRLEQEIDVTPTAIALDAAQTTLPSHHDPAAGKWIPKIAIAAGEYDHLESILGKMGLGTVDGNGTYTGTAGQLDLVENGGPTLNASVGTLAQIAGDPARLGGYHILFIPCSGDDFTSALRDTAVLRNLRDYVKKGGKLYVTDWSGEWMDNVFPTQIRLGADGPFGNGIDTPASAYNAATDSWNTGQFGSADGAEYDSPDARADDPDLASWLAPQKGPNPSSTSTSPIDPTRFEAVHNWNFVEGMAAVEVGKDNNGQPIIDTPKAWVSGSNPGPFGGGSRHPLTVTFEPAGCGRVLFSTYHTTETAHRGLFPQERILLYLIMEIGVCSDKVVIQ
jgi:hypothetical protein